MLDMGGKPLCQLLRERASRLAITGRQTPLDGPCRPENRSVLIHVALTRRKIQLAHPRVLLRKVIGCQLNHPIQTRGNRVISRSKQSIDVSRERLVFVIQLTLTNKQAFIPAEAGD